MSDYIKMYTSPRYKFEYEEASRLKKELETKAVFSNGVARWKSNNNCIPRDCAEFAEFLGLPIDLDAHMAAKQQDDRKFLEEYRRERANYTYSEEELFEMRAAFGHTTIVDVFSGQTIQL